MKDIEIGDEVFCYRSHMYARVEDIFPAAVCVKIAQLDSVRGQTVVTYAPHLWRADEIENLSMCHYCGSRAELAIERATGVPFRACALCRSVMAATRVDGVAAPLESR